MIPVETILAIREDGKKLNDREVNSTMIYFENSYKCHNIPQV
jgi:hypothetical protein